MKKKKVSIENTWENIGYTLILAGVIGLFIFVFHDIIATPVAENVNFPVTEVQEAPKEPITFTYDYIAIQEEVVNLTKEYFYFKDKYTLNTQNVELGESLLGQWNYYAVKGVGKELIYVGTELTTNRSDIYKLIYVHEYTHHILFMLNSTIDDTTHEALADAFTWYIDRETNTELFGEDNSGHGSASYQIVITPILQNGNFDCLNKVFVKTNKIRSVAEYERRLRVYCNSTI